MVAIFWDPRFLLTKVRKKKSLLQGPHIHENIRVKMELDNSTGGKEKGSSGKTERGDLNKKPSSSLNISKNMKEFPAIEHSEREQLEIFQ